MEYTATAVIVTATLQVVGLVKESNQPLVVDSNKVKISREKLRKEMSSRETSEIIALYFDGRKNKTLYMEKGTDMIYRQKQKRGKHFAHQ